MTIYPRGSKSEWAEQAEAIALGEIQMGVSDIPMLLKWLRDMNWPGASEIGEFLSSFGCDLIPSLREVFNVNDGVWSRWVLTVFSEKFGCDFWTNLHLDLVKIAENEQDEEGANVEALYILALTKLEQKNWVKKRLERIQMSNLLPPEVI